MSGIAGIYHRDGKPVDPRDLDRMLDSISHRGRALRRLITAVGQAYPEG